MTWGSLATAVCFYLCGSLVLALVRPARRRGLLERSATATMLGLSGLVVLYVALVWIFGPLPIALGRGLLIALSLGGLAAILTGRDRGDEAQPAPREPWTPVQRVGLVLTVFFALFSVFYCGSGPVHIFDPIFHFAHKGKVIFHEGFGTEAWRIGGTVGRIMTHPDYPPGIGAVQGVLGWVQGSFDEDAARALIALFALAPGAWLFAALRRRGRGAALAGALMWVGLPILFYIRLPHREFLESLSALVLGTEWTNTQTLLRMTKVPVYLRPDGWIMDGAGDLPLAALFFGALVHLWRCWPGSSARGDGADARIAGLLLGAALLMKNEGLALAAVLALAWVLAGLCDPGLRSLAGARRLLQPLLAAYTIAVAALIPWLIIRRSIPSIDEGYLRRLTPTILGEQAGEHVPMILSEFGQTLVNPAQWNLLWVIFAAALLWSLRRPRQLCTSDAWLPVLAVLGGLLLYFLILIVTPWDLGVLFNTAIPERLFLHLTPVAILGGVALLWTRRPAR